jgi:hypothetical protein
VAVRAGGPGSAWVLGCHRRGRSSCIHRQQQPSLGARFRSARGCFRRSGFRDRSRPSPVCTWNMGALSQPARHITASTVTRPSGVVSPTWMPRFSHSFCQEFIGAAQGAGQVVANLDAVFPPGSRGKGCRNRQSEATSVGVMSSRFRRYRPGLLGDKTMLALGQVEQGHDGSALVLRRVFWRGSARFLGIFFSKSVHRSTSPNTTSMVPIRATRSATRWPLASKGRICRLTKEGVRQ